MTTIHNLAALRAFEIDQNSAAIPLATRVFYMRQYLSTAIPLLVHDMWGEAATLPKNSGDSVMWRRFKRLSQNTVPLTEGVTPNGRSIEFENVVATVKQYGDFAVISDWVDMTFIDPIISKAVEALSEMSGESLDSVTRDIINAGTNFYRSTADGNSPAYGAGARSTVNACLTKKVLDAAVTKLVTAGAKMITKMSGASPNTDTQPMDAAYICIIHPHVTHSLRQTASGLTGDHGFLPRERYANTGVLYKGEVGKYGNVRFIETTNAKVWADVGGGTNDGTDPATATYRSSGSTGCDVYSCLLFGREAYGVVKLAGAAQTFINKAGGPSDPIHQRNTVGYKAAKTAAILEDDWIIRIEVAALW